MRRLLFGSFVALLIVSVAPPASAAAVPAAARFRGHDLVSWQREYMRWATGSASSPVVAGGCGEVMHGVLFLAPAAVPGTTTVECDVAPGTPILVLVAATFSEIPTWGSNDDEIIADALATWSQLSDNFLEVNGSRVSLAGRFRNAGAYDVVTEEGSVYDFLCEGVPDSCPRPPGPIRLASVGEFVVLRPLPPGEHQVIASTSWGDITLQMDASIHVG